MTSRVRKLALLALIPVLLFSSSRLQVAMNRDRERLGLTRVAALDNAPPMLAFTTVALGGFRGLIANLLWTRAVDLQDQGKYFEMVQLADWITKLEPHYLQVWVNQAWNMSYNISVKFKDAADRWRWVQRGIELLRDEGLKYNPNEPLLFRELGWHFQHKMGANLDDAHNFYKLSWYFEMTNVMHGAQPDFDVLIAPQTDEARARAKLLTEKYKMDPAFMKSVDARYGPLDWRLPEAHAIYWAAKGLEQAAKNPSKVNPDDLIQLRRVVYQSMQLAFHRGRIVPLPAMKGIELSPNLALVQKTSDAYEEAMRDDAKMRESIARAHRNMVKDAVYFLYLYNREEEAAKWYRYLIDHYPNQTLLYGDTNSLPTKLSLEEYALARVAEDIGDGNDPKRIKAAVEGVLQNHLLELVKGEEASAEQYYRMAEKIYQRFLEKTAGSEVRVQMAPFNTILDERIQEFLKPETHFPPEWRDIIRTKYNIPAATPVTTNAPPAVVSAATTNGPPPAVSGVTTNAARPK